MSRFPYSGCRSCLWVSNLLTARWWTIFISKWNKQNTVNNAIHWSKTSLLFAKLLRTLQTQIDWPLQRKKPWQKIWISGDMFCSIFFQKFWVTSGRFKVLDMAGILSSYKHVLNLTWCRTLKTRIAVLAYCNLLLFLEWWNLLCPEILSHQEVGEHNVEGHPNVGMIGFGTHGAEMHRFWDSLARHWMHRLDSALLIQCREVVLRDLRSLTTIVFQSSSKGQGGRWSI